jgi:hypothetical protein
LLEQAVSAAADAAQVSGLPVAHDVERLVVHSGEPGGRGAAVMADAMDGSVMARVAVERVEEPLLIKDDRASTSQTAHNLWRRVWSESQGGDPVYVLPTLGGLEGV